MKQRLKRTQQFNSTLGFVLNSNLHFWASWNKTNGKLVCSYRLRKKLGVTRNAVISFKYIQYLFESFNFDAFFECVHNNQRFEKEYQSIDGEFFLIYGAAENLNGEITYTLWFKNISHQKAKTDLQNDIIHELTIERDIMQDMLDHLPWPLWYKTKQNKILFCNKAYANALDTLADKVVLDQLHLKPLQRGRALNLTDLVLSTKQAQTQKSHIVIKNERKFVEFAELLTSKEKVLGYLADLSSEENLLNEISHLTKSTHEILEVLSIPVIIYNHKQQVEFFNNQFVKMFEVDVSWLETKPTFSEVLEELRAKRKIPDTEDFQAYKKRRLECFHSLLGPIEDISYYPNGKTVRMVTAPYHNGGLIVTLNDITDWLMLERQYNTLLAVHRQVADNLFEGLAVFGSDHRLKLYNAAFRKMWFYTEKELDPLPHFDTVIERIKQYIDYQHYDDSWDNFKKRIRAKIIDRTTQKEGRIKLYNDTVYDYLYTPLPDGSNLLTFLDVSDRFRIEKSLLERSEALEVAHGIKSDFISNIYQGIKYPLKRILLTFSDLINTPHEKTEIQNKQQLKTLWEEAEHILRFVEDANELAYIESGNTSLTLKKVDVAEIVRSVILTLQEPIERKNIQMNFSCGDQPVIYLGDLRRLKQVFFNLLRNAVTFANEDETINAIVRIVNNSVEVEISNTLAIIPYEDAFGASKKLKRGQEVITGLGYSLIKKIIQLHKAEIILEQENATKVVCIFKTEK